MFCRFPPLFSLGERKGAMEQWRTLADRSPLRWSGAEAEEMYLGSFDDMNHALRAQAALEKEKASLQASCDALQASLARERAWRAEAEKRKSVFQEENTALRDALSAALGSPFGGDTGASGRDEVMVPLKQYADLLRLARQYRQTLNDLKTLQEAMRQDTASSGTTPINLFTAFPLEVAPLPHNPLADDLLLASGSPSATPLPPQPPKPRPSSPDGAPSLSLSPSVPHPQESAVTACDAVGQRSPSRDVVSTPPRKEGTATPTPLRTSRAPSPPPPPSLGLHRTRLPVCHAALDVDVRAEIAHPTTLTGSALKERLHERGGSTPLAREEERLSDRPTPLSPLPKDPSGRSALQERSAAHEVTSTVHLSRVPRLEGILPGKLDLEVYPYVDEVGREKRKQRWVVVNRTEDTHYTVEYRFASLADSTDQDTDVVLLSDARVTQDGRFVMAVAPGVRKPFLEGHPGRHTVVVRLSGDRTDPVSAAVPQAASAAVAGQPIAASVVGSREPSRRSATMPPPPPPLVTSSTTNSNSTVTARSSVTQPFLTCTTDEVNGGGGGGSAGSGRDGVGVSAPPAGSGGLAPQYRDALAALSQETAIAQADETMMRLVKELQTLAASFHVADDPAAIAALCGKRGVDYVDADFPPVTASLGNGAAGCRLYSAVQRRKYYLRWFPVTACTPRSRHVGLSSSVGVDPCALRVGMLGDRGVVAALAALAESAGAVTSLFASTTTDDEANGVYRVWLCNGGEWVLTSVDAYLPCVTEGVAGGMDSSGAAPGPHTTYGCANVLSCDAWGSVCEKALAKLLGSYHALKRVSAASALGLLTGGPVEVWDWWHHSSEVAFDEIEAAVNTNARGSGIVVVTTRSCIKSGVVSALRRRGGAASVLEEVELSFEAAGLLPDTSYRVLAASENAKGEPMLLLRNWQRRSLDEAQAFSTRGGGGSPGPESRMVSPNRGDEPTSADAHLNQAATVVRDGDSCLWLNYEKEVLPFCESCHVCFDCRRYHDVRVPIRFHVEGDVGPSSGFSSAPPAVPSHVLQVTVKPSRRRSRLRRHQAEDKGFSGGEQQPRKPARMWIGLHQPTDTSVVTADRGQRLPHGLRLSLIGHHAARTAQARRSTETALLPPSYYLLSESYNGEFRELPAVWMYVELEVPENATSARRRTNVSGHQPFLFSSSVAEDASTSVSSSSSSGARESDEDASFTFYVLPQLSPVPAHQPPTLFAVPPTEKTAFLAVLAEDKELFDVKLLVAPEEMKAAMYHSVLERLDFQSCAAVKEVSKSKRTAGPPVNGSRQPPWWRGGAGGLDSMGQTATAWCQVNGRWREGFWW